MNSARRGSPDFTLLVLTLILVGFGLVMVFSASSSTAVTSHKFQFDALYFTKRQAIWAVFGTFVMLFTMNVPYQKIKKWVVPFFMFVLFMLVAVLFVGAKINGARSWFGIGTYGIQPAEFAKLAVVLYLASLISKKGEKIREFQKGLLPILIVVGFVSFLIMLQPDLGACAILLFCAAIVVITGGAKSKHLMSLCMVGGTFLVCFAAIYFLTGDHVGDYKVGRFTAFLNPWEDPLGTGYNLRMSLLAFGHGGITGAGFGQSIQKLSYLPYPYNDFIFPIIGEEFGYIGTLLFLLTFLTFIWRGIIVSLKASDVFGTLTGTGIMSMFGIQALINIGGVTGTIPLTGVTLPFISYGGSSLLLSMFSMGILLSISREHQPLAKSKNTRNKTKTGRLSL